MLKVLLIVALAIVVVAICILALAALKPGRFTIRRSIAINAPRERVFALVNDLHRWTEWSQDRQEESAGQRRYSGPPAGKGAVYEWDGKGSAGKGRIEIVESSANEIRLQADWQKPFAARNINLFVFEPKGSAIQVTWELDGENVFALKVMTTLVSVDRLMGSHFERGLAGLKAAAEKSKSLLILSRQ